jgi:hypothetical protein
LKLRILKDFKSCVLKLRILKGLLLVFAELRILKGLTQNESKVESLESKGVGQDEWKIGRVAGLVHVFLNTSGGSGQAPGAEGAEGAETE